MSGRTVAAALVVAVPVAWVAGWSAIGWNRERIEAFQYRRAARR